MIMAYTFFRCEEVVLMADGDGGGVGGSLTRSLYKKRPAFHYSARLSSS